MTVLAAVDDEGNSDGLLGTARRLATAFDDDLVVLHVMTDRRFNELQENRDNYFVDEATGEATDIAEAEAGSVLDGFDAVEYRGRVGDPVESIIEAADDLDARYVVLGGRRRTPVGKVVFGSVTQSVLLNADRPVVTVMIEA